MSRTARQLATEETRGRVIRGARRVFADQGYAGASMRQIAAEVGLTPMALYTYATSKAELFELVYEDGIELIYAEFSEVVAGHDRLLDEVTAILQRGGEILERDPELLHFTMRVPTEARHDDLRDISILAPPYLSFFGRLTRRAIDRGEISEDERDRLVAFITMLLWSITITTSIDPSQVGDAVATAMWAARGRLTGDR